MSRNHKRNHALKRHSVSVIGGQYRHRKVEFFDVEDLRPTGARLRETLFNWLQADIAGARCLDLFAGSGILGVEALSRGAVSVTFVEKKRQAAQQLQQTLAVLGVNNAHVVNCDYRQVPEQPFDVVFLDPPYKLNILPELVAQMPAYGPQLIFIEDERPFDTWIDKQNFYELYKSKKAGGIYYGLLRPAVK